MSSDLVSLPADHGAIQRLLRRMAAVTLAISGALISSPDVSRPTPLFEARFLAFEAGDNPTSLAVGDVNADGKPDLVVAHQSANTVSVLLGKGDGKIAEAMGAASARVNLRHMALRLGSWDQRGQFKRFLTEVAPAVGPVGPRR